jgi:hypothetical protein
MEGLPTARSLYDESCKLYNTISKEAMAAAIAVGFPKVATCATAKGLFHCTLNLPNDLMTTKFLVDVQLEFERAGYKVKINSDYKHNHSGLERCNSECSIYSRQKSTEFNSARSSK